MESMTANYTALAKQTETLCEMESDSCCQDEKRLRAHDTFLHLTDLFVDSNRLNQWPQMRKPKLKTIIIIIIYFPSHQSNLM